MLLDMKHQIAAVAGRKKIEPSGDCLQWTCIVQSQHLLPAAPDVVSCVAIAPFGDEGSRQRHILAPQFTVEADIHYSAWAQQCDQRSPARQRVGHMMKHADCFDQIERAAERAEIEDIGLHIFQPREADLLGLALGVGEACSAEVERNHLRADELTRRHDRMLAGAASGDQHVERALPVERAKRSRWELRT